MTVKELFQVFADYSLKISITGDVHFMDERIGSYECITSNYGDYYYFVPNKNDPDNINDYTLFNREDKLREFFDRKSLWFKQIKEQKRTEKLKEDFND